VYRLKLWEVEADELTNISDEFLYATPSITSFLRNDSSLFLVVATKGFGKTLLLRAKRQQLEAQDTGILIIPDNTMLDKPLGSGPIFSHQDLLRVNNDQVFWENTWLIAITIAIAKLVAAATGNPVSQTFVNRLNPALSPLLTGGLRTITEIFGQVLALPAKQYYDALPDLQSLLGPAFRDIHTPVVAFIDNVDEHFNAHLGEAAGASAGATDKGIWYLAQMGLASAIRQLHVQNHHVKIFASIRSEAFGRLLQRNQLIQQLEGSALRIKYEPEDLREIFVRHLVAEKDANTVEPRSRDPFARFFGSQNLLIVHPRVGEPEKIWDYILRHTLGRPRDLMTIGRKLSAVGRAKRTDQAIRRAVNDASKDIATAYLQEVNVHFDQSIDFDRLFALIPKNVLRSHEMRGIAQTYTGGNDNYVPNARNPYIHVFCSLFKAGLLGYIAKDMGSGLAVQEFSALGENLFIADGLLPASDYYIVHPALDAHIRTRSSLYARGMDTLNIAGNGRDWRNPSHQSAVIKADVVGYSKIMLDASRAATFSTEINKILDEWRGRLAHVKSEGGDGIVLIDRNAANLLVAIRAIAARLAADPYNAVLRAGADFGATERSGLALRTAARLEAIGSPGVLCATAEFANEVEKIDDRQARIDISAAPKLSKCPRRGDTFNIRKNRKDPDLWKQVVVFPVFEWAKE